MMGREDKKNKHNSAFFKEGKENNKLFRKKNLFMMISDMNI